MFVSTGIFFNHESPRRGREFITRKVTTQLAEILHGDRSSIEVGNVNAFRDWDYAPDYMEAMRLIGQAEIPDDLVIATEEGHTVQELLDYAFSIVGLNWSNFTKVAASQMRPNDVPHLLGSSTKAKRVLGWEARVKFRELVKLMVDADVKCYTGSSAPTKKVAPVRSDVSFSGDALGFK